MHNNPNYRLGLIVWYHLIHSGSRTTFRQAVQEQFILCDICIPTSYCRLVSYLVTVLSWIRMIIGMSNIQKSKVHKPASVHGSLLVICVYFAYVCMQTTATLFLQVITCQFKVALDMFHLFDLFYLNQFTKLCCCAVEQSTSQPTN